MAEKTFHIDFEGYWTVGMINLIPARSGIYCVYECDLSGDDRPGILRLLHIGEVELALRLLPEALYCRVAGSLC